MKKAFMKITTIAGCIVGLFLIVTACSDHAEEVTPKQPEDEVPGDVISQLEELGFNTEGIRMEGKQYLVEGDMMISPEALAEMLTSQAISVPGVAGEEQYRTYNLVNCNGSRTIHIRSYINTGVISTGIDYAIANWNALNICFTFQRVYSGSADIYIYSKSGSGGSSCFPSGGNPCNKIYIGTDITNSQVAECVVTHELGHCFGLRHTDYFNRAYSCGSGGNEGSGGVGAVHIPGTPTWYDPSSVMNSCYSPDTNGEFSYYDRICLEYFVLEYMGASGFNPFAFFTSL